MQFTEDAHGSVVAGDRNVHVPQEMRHGSASDRRFD
jgi:hypothetical protein